MLIRLSIDTLKAAGAGGVRLVTQLEAKAMRRAHPARLNIPVLGIFAARSADP